MAAARETTAVSPQGETPREGANQHHAAEDAEWAHQAGSGDDYDAGALIALGAGFPRLSALDARHLFPSMAPCSGSRKPIEIFFINTNLKL